MGSRKCRWESVRTRRVPRGRWGAVHAGGFGPDAHGSEAAGGEPYKHMVAGAKAHMPVGAGSNPYVHVGGGPDAHNQAGMDPYLFLGARVEPRRSEGAGWDKNMHVKACLNAHRP